MLMQRVVVPFELSSQLGRQTPGDGNDAVVKAPLRLMTLRQHSNNSSNSSLCLHSSLYRLPTNFTGTHLGENLQIHKIIHHTSAKGVVARLPPKVQRRPGARNNHEALPCRLKVPEMWP